MWNSHRQTKPAVRAIATVIILGALAAMTLAAQQPSSVALRLPDVIYMPTPTEVVTAMLKLANVAKDDVVYDLGSGDGRVVIAAVKEFGARRGIGVEIDLVHVQEARANARRAGVSDRVEFRQQDLFLTDLRPATVVAIYLGEAVNLRLRPKLLKELQPGARVVSHAFHMGDWDPQETRTVSGRPLYLWKIR